MSNISYIALGLGALYLLSRSKGKRILSGIRLRITGVAPTGIRDLTITFTIDNPNSTDMIIKSVVGVVWVNGAKVGRVSTFNNVTIKGNSSTNVPVTVALKPLKAIATMIDMIKNKKVANSKIVFEGTINVNDVAHPVKATYTV